MSKLDKLFVLGVRSFDNKRGETIQFHTPLTLIVGYNGSGKTTIIECLKYATTGDLPPNSKGGAFIHDPSLCGEKEVLAQVKMSFSGTAGAKMVLSRRLQLTVKKATRVQKTLEGSLQTIQNGERSSISSRVAELDQLMPQYLGVSKAVLDSVIFCHQDESLWPMSEPSVLKKKFDEIFEALKYTKAIDNIKKLRKEKNEELKQFKITESFTKGIKDKGDRAEKQSKALNAELEVLRNDITQLHAEAKQAGEKSREAFDRAANYESEVASLKNKQERRSFLKETIESLGSNLKKRNESDEWLETELNQFEARMSEHQENEERQVKHYQDLERTIRNTEDKLSRKHAEAGKYQEQKENHEQQIEKRKSIIKSTSRAHKIRGYDADLDDMQINEYMEKISRLSKDQTSAVEKVRRETEVEIRKAQDVLNRLGQHKSALKEKKSSSREYSAANEREMASKQSDMNNIDTDEGGKAILEANIEDLQSRLKTAKEDFRKASWESRINEVTVQRRALEEESKQLKSDLFDSTKQAGELAQLETLKQEIAELDRNLDKMKGVHGEQLQRITGHKWDPQELDTQFHEVLVGKVNSVKEVERQREAVSRGLEQVEYKLGNAKAELKNAEKELATCTKHLYDNVEGEPEKYFETLSMIQQVRDQHKADSDNHENLKKYYSQAIERAEQDHDCKLCKRAFHGDELKPFIKKMRANMTKDVARQIADDLKEEENNLRRAKEAGPSHDTWVRLSETEIPRLQAEVKKLGTAREEILHETESHDKAVADKEEVKSDVELLAKPVSIISNYYQDRVNKSRKLEVLIAKQDDTGGSRTLEDIRKQLDVVDSKSQAIDRDLTKFRTEESRARSLINTLDLDLSKADKSLSTVSHQLEKKRGLSKRIEELRSKNREYRAKIRDFDAELERLEPQIAEEETKLEDKRQRGKDKERGLQQEATKLSDTVQRLDLAAQNIAAYNESGGPANLARCQREVENIDQEIVSMKNEVRQVTVNINKIKSELRDAEGNKLTIANNIKHRQELRKLKDIDVEIARLQAENAEADRNHWRRESSKWQRAFDERNAEKTSKIATAKAKDDQLATLIREWETDYKSAAHDFKKAHIHVETTKAAVEDLGRYGGALDKAIMKYHSIKMEEINRIIEELWKKTYQGTDVDTILIRSDNEAAKGNRSYNYRVSMVKQDTEMDMRGRCSAGQKVLASIIIRLALAECFGVNCGLIALDEPTTNLDRDNIRSLATALHDIIETRRHQSNFQLIVITHDEEFLKFMKCPEFCDHYYRVSRDERQNSTIERQWIAEVM